MGEDATNELFALVRDLKAESAAQTAILKRMEAELADKDARLRSLELKDARRSGVLAVASIIGGLIVTILSWIINPIVGRLQ